MINAGTGLLALLGNPVGHSLSPLIHNTACERLGLNYVYLAFRTVPADLEQVVKGLVKMNCRGFNLTIPFKAEIIPLLDEVEETAAMIRSVNTVCVRDGRMIGHSTDGPGFIADLREKQVDIKNKRIAIIGAGGAATAVAAALLSEGIAELTVLNRHPENARAMLDNLKVPAGVTCRIDAVDSPRSAGYLSEADIIVQATPVGMPPRESESPWRQEQVFHEGQTVYDLIYNPRKTRFLTMAESRGACCYNGLGMLVNQAVLSFKLWFDTGPPVQDIINALKKAGF